jgi:hypothetical protein
MLRAAVLAAWLATAYCGAKGSPHPPAREAADAGPASPAPPAAPTPPADAGTP